VGPQKWVFFRRIYINLKCYNNSIGFFWSPKKLRVFFKKNQLGFSFIIYIYNTKTLEDFLFSIPIKVFFFKGRVFLCFVSTELIKGKGIIIITTIIIKFLG